MNKDELNNKNYYENNDYMSASQFKDFLKCEAYGLAKYRGEWKEEATTPMLVGSYVDAYFSGEMPEFTAKHPEIFKRDGTLKFEFVIAEKVIQRIKNDDYFLSLISGEMQTVETGVINGVEFKGKFDSLFENLIVDLKCMKDVKDVWVDGYEPFWKAYGYDIQLAIYQYLHEQNTGKKVPCKLAVATKENIPDLHVYKFKQETLDNALKLVMNLAPRYDDIKKGLIKPHYCGHCDYCKSIKKLNESMEEEI